MKSKSQRNHKERGVALLIALIALILLTAIAATMIFSSNIESGINTNYRAEQQAYFAARAGLEEARVRMLRPTNIQLQPAGTGDLCGGSLANVTCPNLPQNVPGAGGGVASTDTIYIINPSTVNAAPGAGVEADDPTSAASYFDDELCKENYNNYALANPGKGLRCGAVPTAAWFRKPSQISALLPDSADPKTKTDSALSYKWVRIAMKQNWSNNAYSVDGFTPGSGSANPYSPICFDGSKEILQTSLAGYGTNCFPNAGGPDLYRPVYVVTSLAVTPNGSRRYLQGEVADTPPLVTNASLDTTSLVTVSGASVTIDGYDACQCYCPPATGGKAPACVLNTDGKTACNKGTNAIFSTQSVSEGSAVVQGQSQPCSGGNSGAGSATCQNVPASNYPYDINALISQYKSAPGVIQNPNTQAFGVPPNATNPNDPNSVPFPPYDPLVPPPTEVPCVHPNGDPTQFDITYPNAAGNWCTQVTYISSSIDIKGGLTGSGVLVVDGDLTLESSVQFYGLILVRGTLTMKGSGCGQVNCGIVGGVVTGTGTVATDNTDNLRGGITIQYDTCALKDQQFLRPPAVLALHEISF